MTARRMPSPGEGLQTIAARKTFRETSRIELHYGKRRARCRVGSDRKHRGRREERQATCRGWITAKTDVSRKTCRSEDRGVSFHES
ncbi:hypothetical protein TNIN_298831 [Trichonephila inaurata madagascariensis]|uniref:Uncharacterized protein n=1 Tax=Trichonephila inaurata madagascariensis TaxID=2747483 RepID=A0A8X6WSG5_9ARAC|nr:hypothetical protein TNIN_298831 [Trichonephila inaurata madagascariensis]